MCESYFDSCSEPECIEVIKKKIEEYTAQNKPVDWMGTWAFTIVEELFGSRSGNEYFLFKGYSEPCKHMKEGHGPECTAVKRQTITYTTYSGKEESYEGYDTCNCDLIEGVYIYY